MPTLDHATTLPTSLRCVVSMSTLDESRQTLWMRLMFLLPLTELPRLGLLGVPTRVVPLAPAIWRSPRWVPRPSPEVQRSGGMVVLTPPHAKPLNPATRFSTSLVFASKLLGLLTPEKTTGVHQPRLPDAICSSGKKEVQIPHHDVCRHPCPCLSANSSCRTLNCIPTPSQHTCT